MKLPIPEVVLDRCTITLHWAPALGHEFMCTEDRDRLERYLYRVCEPVGLYKVANENLRRELGAEMTKAVRALVENDTLTHMFQKFWAVQGALPGEGQG